MSRCFVDKVLSTDAWWGEKKICFVRKDTLQMKPSLWTLNSYKHNFPFFYYMKQKRLFSFMQQQVFNVSLLYFILLCPVTLFLCSTCWASSLSSLYPVLIMNHIGTELTSSPGGAMWRSPVPVLASIVSCDAFEVLCLFDTSKANFSEFEYNVRTQHNNILNTNIVVFRHFSVEMWHKVSSCIPVLVTYIKSVYIWMFFHLFEGTKEKQAADRLFNHYCSVTNICFGSSLYTF